MRMRRVLLTSVASVGLLIGAAGLPSAYAQKGVFLSPSSQWAVTKVAANEPGASGYCAVAKRYEGNAIMTIARNQGAEISFALDLQKPAFNISQPLDIVLDPGAGEQRSYSAMPASSQAFVVKLGQDEKFFDAISRTGMLRIEVASNSYVFNISDIDIGQTKLNSCLASAVQPAAGGPVSFPIEAESTSNKEFIDGLHARIQSLESQNNSLKEDIVKAEGKAEIVQAVAEPKVLKGDEPDVKKLNISPVSINVMDNLRAENLRLMAALQTKEAVAPQIDAKLQALEQENSRLTAELSKQSNVTADVAGLNARISTLLNEKADLEQKLLSVPDVNVSAFEEDIESLKRENKALQKALIERSSVDTSPVDVSEFKAQISSLQQENATLKTALQNVDSNADAIARLQAKITQAERENRALQDVVQASTEEKNKIQAQLEQSDQSDELEAIRRESSDKVAMLQGTIDALKAKLSGQDAQKAELEELQGEIASLTSENASLRDSLSSDAADADVLAKAQQDVESLKAEIAAKDTELQKFDAVPARLQKLLSAYRDVQAEKKILQEKVALQDAQFGSQEQGLAAKNDQIASLEGENAVLKQQLKDGDALVAQLAEAQEKNMAFEKKLAGLQDQVVAMSALNDELNVMQGNLAQKESEIAQLSALQDELTRVTAENESIRAEKEKLSYALEQSLQMSEEKIAALEEKRAEDVATIADLEEKNVRLEGEHETVLQKLAALVTERDALDQKVAVVADASGRETTENLELRRTLSAVLDKLTGQKQALREKEDNLQSVVAQNETLRSQLDLAAQLISGAPDNTLSMAEQNVDEAQEQEVAVRVANVVQAVAAPVVSAPKPSVKPVVHAVEEIAARDVAAEMSAMQPAAGDEMPVEVIEEEDMTIPAEDLVGADVANEEAVLQQPVAAVIEEPSVTREAQEFMGRDLNQAQIYEEQLKRSIQTGADTDVAVAPQQEISVEVEDLSEPLLANGLSDADELPALDNDAPVEMRMSQDPFDGLEQASGAEDVAALDDAIVQEDAAPSLPVTVKQPRSSEVMISDIGGVKGALERAHVENVSNIHKVYSSSIDAYQWRAGDLYGSGEQKPMASFAQFDEYVKEYLTRTEGRCQGDFAIVPDNSKERANMRVDSYEVACVGKGVSSSASLVFYNDGNLFTVLAHEAEAEKMDQAMRVRDKIFTSLSDG